MNAQEGNTPAHGLNKATGKDFFTALKEAGLIGIWKDRTDIKDSASFARELRQKAWGQAND